MSGFISFHIAKQYFTSEGYFTREAYFTNILLNPVTVKVGCSDGETVEVLEGLANGLTYYYAYYDTLEISFTPDFGGGGFMFG